MSQHHDARIICDLRNKAARLENALEECIRAMKMQLCREKGESHIPPHTAKWIWDEAINKGEKLLGRKVHP